MKIMVDIRTSFASLRGLGVDYEENKKLFKFAIKLHKSIQKFEVENDILDIFAKALVQDEIIIIESKQ